MTYIADIITGGPCQNDALLNSFMATVATAKATAPEAHLLWLGGNCAPGPIEDYFKAFLATLGYEYVRIEEPYNCARWWILGKELTAAKWGGEFTVFAACDLLFHPGWLDNIVDLWRSNPDYFCLAPFSWGRLHHTGLNYRSDDLKPRREILPCDHPAPWCFVRRRDDDYVPDLRFKDWNVEFDFYEWMKFHGRKAGVCLNARVDHTGYGPRRLGDFGFDLNANITEGKALFDEKWNTAHLEGQWVSTEDGRGYAAPLTRQELAAPGDMNGSRAMIGGEHFIIERLRLPGHVPPWRRGEPIVYFLKKDSP
jgi:hypothetical protein